MSTQHPTAPTTVTEAVLQDGSRMAVEVYGEGPTLLLPINPRPVEGEQAEQLRQYGTDPALGQSFIRGLSDRVRVAAFDYEGHLWQHPRPQTLTPENVVRDLLAVADAVGAQRFVYYGYSWLGMIALQLALRTDRLAALAMGGFPPLDGPYRDMLTITTAGYQMSGADSDAASEADEWSTARLSKAQTQQFMTLYEALQDFDDEAAQAHITCPRLCIMGSADEMHYGPNWGDLLLSLAGPVIAHADRLRALGWSVHVLDGLDHMQAMQAAPVVPILRGWLSGLGIK